MTSQQQVAVGDLFDALSERDRRTALRTVRDRTTPLELDALAESVAHRRNDTTESEVRANLHHAHLPKLDGAGLLDYDPAQRTVRCEWSDDVESSVRDAIELLDVLARESE